MTAIRWKVWWLVDRLAYYVFPDKGALLLMRKFGWLNVKKAREAIAEDDRTALQEKGERG